MSNENEQLNVAPRMLDDQVVSYDVVQQPVIDPASFRGVVLNDPYQDRSQDDSRQLKDCFDEVAFRPVLVDPVTGKECHEWDTGKCHVFEQAFGAPKGELAHPESYMATPYATAPAGTGADYGLEMMPTAEQLDKAFEQLKQVQEEGAPFPAIDSLGGLEPQEETEFEKSFKHHPMSDWRANITHDEIDAKDISPEAKEMMHASLRQFENQVVAKGDYDGNVMWTRQKHNSFKNRGMGVTRAPASKRKLKKKKK